MYTVFLAGGIASGKSTVACLLEQHGAYRIDLDQISREVLEAGSPLLNDIADAFGADLLDSKTGMLNRKLLAERAFATQEGTARLEQLELPAITEHLVQALDEHASCMQASDVCVVEIPLLDRVENMFDLADEILAVVAPLELRRTRAIARGMTPEDFDARIAHQPTDDYLRAHATYIIDNSADSAALEDAVNTWWEIKRG